MHVARGDVAPGGGDADERLFEILGLEADGIKHGAGGGAFVAVKHDARVGPQGIGRFGFFHRGRFCLKYW